MFQKIYEKHVTFWGEGGSLEEPRYVTRGGSKSGLKKATWFVYGPQPQQQGFGTVERIGMLDGV